MKYAVLAVLLSACQMNVDDVIRAEGHVRPLMDSAMPDLVDTARGSQVTFLIKDLPGKIVGYTRCFGTGCEIDLDPRGHCDLELVMVHELGHALGLKHVPDPKDIMYPSCVGFTMDTATAVAQVAEHCRHQQCNLIVIGGPLDIVQ